MENRFDCVYDIRLGKLEDIPQIMEFIDRYWKKGHILATNRSFFEYEMVIDGQVNFLLAINREKMCIEGVLGFLPCSRDSEHYDVWGVIWKTVPEALPMLGIELMKRLKTTINARTQLGVGANPKTAIPLLKRICRFYTAKMKHYYMLSDKEEYSIAVISKKPVSTPDFVKDFIVEKLHSIDDVKEYYCFEKHTDVIPYKDAWYYDRRFFKHPIYEYNAWGIKKDDRKAIIFFRVQEHEDEAVIRIVDYLGDQSVFAYCGGFFKELLNKYEYIDFYFDGFIEEYVKKAGMTKVEEDDENIIPDYFNPYLQKNVDIFVNSSNNEDLCLFFKADGDQDRPN